MLVRKTAALDRFEGKQAILILEHGQEFRVLKEELGEVKEGDVFTIQIMPEREASLEKEELARVLLNQILQSDSPSHE
jgi:hypothetical protein